MIRSRNVCGTIKPSRVNTGGQCTAPAPPSPRALQTWRVCFHEAAHAVVAKRLGLRVGLVSAFAEGGECAVKADHVPLEDRDRRLAATAFAGPIAEALFCRCWPAQLASFAHDVHTASEYAPADQAARIAFFDRAGQTAEAIIRSPNGWREIQHLATLLFREGAARPVHAFSWDDWRRIPGGKWQSPGGRVLSDAEYQKQRSDNPTNDERKEPAFPADHELAGGPSRELKPGGQVRAVTVGDREYIVKQSPSVRESGPVEEIVAGLARSAGVRVPAARMTTVGGRPALVQEHAAGQDLGKLHKRSPEAARALVAKIPRAEIDRHVLFEYLVGNTDVHLGNYLVTPEGRLTAIDKELVLGRGNLKGQKFEPPALLSLTRPDGAGMLHTFDPATVATMAAAGERMAQALAARGMKREARQVADRVVVLKKLAGGTNTTAGELHRLGAKGVAPPDLGLLGRGLWHLTRNFNEGDAEAAVGPDRGAVASLPVRRVPLPVRRFRGRRVG